MWHDAWLDCLQMGLVFYNSDASSSTLQAVKLICCSSFMSSGGSWCHGSLLWQHPRDS